MTDIQFTDTPSIRSGLVLVSPKMAETLLGRQGKNRQLSQRMVTRYADGFHQDTTIYQPIILDAAGRVLDGQHRLQAIVQYGHTVAVWFIVGVPPSYWQDFDQGKPRTLADVLSATGVINASAAASLLNLVHRYEVGNFDGSYQPNRDTLVCEYERNIVAYASACAFAVQRRDINVVASPAQVAFITFHLGADAALLDSFWNILATGVGAKSGSPGLLYRNTILTRSTGGRKTGPHAKLAMLIKAVNAELTGHVAKLLRHSNDESMPVLLYVRGKAI